MKFSDPPIIPISVRYDVYTSDQPMAKLGILVLKRV